MMWFCPKTTMSCWACHFNPRTFTMWCFQTDFPGYQIMLDDHPEKRNLKPIWLQVLPLSANTCWSIGLTVSPVGQTVWAKPDHCHNRPHPLPHRGSPLWWQDWFTAKMECIWNWLTLFCMYVAYILHKINQKFRWCLKLCDSVVVPTDFHCTSNSLHLYTCCSLLCTSTLVCPDSCRSFNTNPRIMVLLSTETSASLTPKWPSHPPTVWSVQHRQWGELHELSCPQRDWCMLSSYWWRLWMRASLCVCDDGGSFLPCLLNIL